MPQFLSKLNLNKFILPDDYEEMKKHHIGNQGPSFGAIQCATRKWFLEINGYDERMVGYTPMDRDIFARAKKSGLKTMRLDKIQFTSCFHQWHPPSWTPAARKYDKWIGDSIVK